MTVHVLPNGQQVVTGRITITLSEFDLAAALARAKAKGRHLLTRKQLIRYARKLYEYGGMAIFAYCHQKYTKDGVPKVVRNNSRRISVPC